MSQIQKVKIPKKDTPGDWLAQRARVLGCLDQAGAACERPFDSRSSFSANRCWLSVPRALRRWR
jgi:hypothetical protein